MGWRHDASRLIGRLAAAAETRWAPLVVAVAAVGVWWLQAVAIPLAGGRDFATYLGAYSELFHSDPIDLGYVLGRTPLSPLVVGVLLDLFHGALAEPLMSLLYAASVTAWFLAARSFGGAAALLTVGIVLLYPGYGIVMHELSSDSVFAIAFAGWSLLVVRVLRSPTPRGFALVGLGVALLVLVRPGNQVLLVLVVIPLLMRASWRTRLVSSAVFLLAAVALLGAWTVHNGVRYGDYTIARGGNTRLPFERAFLTDRIVRPENGPSSRKLARAVQRELLPQEPYRSYGIHLDDFFSDPSPRMIDDLGALANRKWGWGNDARILRDVAIEADTHAPRDVLTRGLDDGLGPPPPAGVSRSLLEWRRAAAQRSAGAVRNAGHDRHRRPEAAAPDGGPADSRTARGRSDEPRREHLHRVDVSDRAPPRLPAPGRRGALHRTPSAHGRAESERPGPGREPHIGASPQPGVALVSTTGPLARARDHRARRSSARRHARSRHASGRSTARDRPRRVGDSVRPALRRPGGAGVRSPCGRRPSRPAPRVTVKMPP